ncbi:DNA adenine methylase [Clostridium paraputrificum]|uniref:DNA adenine methylase n=1 Tax=Clostridium paraputrificum TaxID=29363 RepID=UPI0034A18852
MAKRSFSPLRYPGGKNKLCDSVVQILDENNIDNMVTYIEPYAGGASVALHLLISGRVRRIIINDIDKSIYAFWFSVLNYTDELCNLINDTEITMEQWRNAKQVLSNMEDYDILEIGFSTLFLNRTNRSGILKGGVIGGKNQAGSYKLDCRFNKEDLISKIKLISKYKKKIRLYNMDTIDFIKNVVVKSRTKNFIFFDPPYYKKGQSLYINYYNHQDHLNLSKKISSLRRHNWIVTYDYTQEIDDMYNGYKKIVYDLQYTAQKKYKGKEIIIFSKQLIVPEDFLLSYI